ncbi:efflux RND transporter periplasmic adaptor subunit [soil metagenome]
MKEKRIAIAVVVAVLAVLAIGAWVLFGRGGAQAGGLFASGTVEATEADLGFQLGGRIEHIAVVEGEAVAVGAELARLESAELSARRDAAAAQVDGARALLAELEHGARPGELRQVAAAEAAARERMQDAQRVLERTRALEAGGAVSRESLDQAQSAFDVASAQYEQAREQRVIVRTGPRPERVDAQRAVVRQAESALAQVDAALSNAVIRAPFAGVVTVRHRQPGEAVTAGAPVLTLMDPGDRWVRIYVPQDAVGRVSIGQSAQIRTDSQRSVTYDGRVTFIGSQAEFTPRNVQTAEQRVKLVYAVKVAIEGDVRMDLKPGLPADVTLAGTQ